MLILYNKKLYILCIIILFQYLKGLIVMDTEGTDGEVVLTGFILAAGLKLVRGGLKLVRGGLKLVRGGLKVDILSNSLWLVSSYATIFILLFR